MLEGKTQHDRYGVECILPPVTQCAACSPGCKWLLYVRVVSHAGGRNTTLLNRQGPRMGLHDGGMAGLLLLCLTRLCLMHEGETQHCCYGRDPRMGLHDVDMDVLFLLCMATTYIPERVCQRGRCVFCQQELLQATTAVQHV